ncbi:unnamed protein product, partial [marine sediment metagenome]
MKQITIAYTAYKVLIIPDEAPTETAEFEQWLYDTNTTDDDYVISEETTDRFINDVEEP